MLRRLHALYLRYAAIHGDRARQVPIGPLFCRRGRVERIARSGHALRVSGWLDAEEVRLSWPGGDVTVRTDLPRADVAKRRNLPLHTGFTATLPAGARPLTLHHDSPTGPVEVILPHPSEAPGVLARLRLARAFWRDILRVSPALVRFLLRPDEAGRIAIKRGLNLEEVARGHPIDESWLEAEPDFPLAAGDDVAIVLPVHNALPILKRCLDRVAAHSDLPWHLVVVDDASTDPDLRPWLRGWVARHQTQVTLIELDQNVGFVGAVNRGLDHVLAGDGAGPVVLLNSDALVPDRWLTRLVAPLADDSIASVTPMSNDAEILSVPEPGLATALRPGAADAMDRVAARFTAPRHWPDLPTGVGFCMAMSRAWLAQEPHFDTAFGRGYGEEVDWCQRVRAQGGRHVAQPGLFVEHVGGQSFGAAEKRLRIRAAGTQLMRRYPAYDGEVQRFIADDPLVTPRLALAIALAADLQDELPVFVAHSMGGGAEIALMQEVAQHRAAIVLRVGGVARWQVEAHVEGACLVGQCEDLSTLRRLLAPATRRRFIYSCGVGDGDPVRLPADLLELRRAGDVFSARLHDYFMISPAYTLLDSDGVFRGVPAADGKVDAAHTCLRPDGTMVGLAEWRVAWGAFIAACDEVVAFSESSAELLRQAYSKASVTVTPHRVSVDLRPAQPGPQAAAFGILGNVNLQKGAFVLRRMAERMPDHTFVVIGHCDSAISMPRNVLIHGTYVPEDITDLAERYGIAAWLMPAIWPETFSFATREALATGLPVAGFALGAQGEALDAAPNGVTVPLDPVATAPARLVSALESRQRPRAAAE